MSATLNECRLARAAAEEVDDPATMYPEFVEIAHRMEANADPDEEDEEDLEDEEDEEDLDEEDLEDLDDEDLDEDLDEDDLEDEE